MDVPVKSEEDEPWFDPTTHAAASTATSNHESPSDTTNGQQKQPTKLRETCAVDEQLASTKFLQSICLVKTERGDGKSWLWPALKFESVAELQNAVENDVDLPSTELEKLQWEIYRRGKHINTGVAYLLGRGKIKRSLVPIRDEGAVEKFYMGIHEIEGKDRYKDDASWQRAYKIATDRINEEMPEETDSDDDSVPLGEITSPVSNQRPSNAANVKAEEVDGAAGTDLVEVAALPDSAETSNQAAASAAPKSGNTLKSNRGGNGPEMEKETGSGRSKPRSKTGSSATKVKKRERATPRPKGKRAPAPVVTPGHTRRDDEGLIAERISPIGEPYGVMTDAEAWELLEAKFGIVSFDGNYHFTSQKEPETIKGPIANLRKDLCAKGLPEFAQPLSEQEKVGIARWVRYANVGGMVDGQSIDPADLGRPIKRFNVGWKILCDNFQCNFTSGNYTVPTSPSGEGRKVFDRQADTESHFARFGIECLPAAIPEEILSKKDRLSLEIYMATRGDVNTFERIKTDDNGNVVLGKRKRAPRNYA